MKKGLLFLIFFSLSIVSFGQDYPIDTYNNQTVQTCRGVFYDSENCSGNYCNNENYKVTFCNPSGQAIRVSFLYSFTESGRDFLRIYDGSSVASPLLATLTGNYSNPFNYTSSGSCLTFVFTSDTSGTDSGWYALIGCQPTNCNGNLPASDACSTATPICDLNGYCGNTNGWYTPDSETTLSGIFCGGIQNNSWMSFIADSTSATFDVNSFNCAYPTSGIQMQIYSTTDCSNFASVSNCVSQSSASGLFTMTTNVPLAVGTTYYIMVDGYAGNACDYTITAQSGVQVIAFSGPAGNQLCTGQSGTVSVSGYQSGSTFSWSASTAGSISGASNGISITATPGTTTTYSCTVTSPSGCLIQVETYTLTVNPLPAPTAANIGAYCAGQTIALSSAGGNSYSWAGPAAFSSISQNPNRPSATPAMAGTYTVTATSTAGCSNTATTTVTVNALPTVTASNTGPFCEGSALSLSAAGGNTYSWTGPNTYNATAQNPNLANATVAMAGTYTVNVTNTTTNCSNTGTTTVVVNARPLANVTGPAGMCSGSSVTLSAATSTAGSGTISVYQWQLNGNNISGATGTTYTTSAGGTYQVIVNNTNNCKDTAAIAIVVNPLPVITGTATMTPSNCNTATGALSGLSVSGTSPFTYSWSNSSNAIVGTTINLSNQPAGLYLLSVTDNKACVSIYGPDSILNFATPPMPTVLAPADYCQGATVAPLSATGTGTINWYPDAGLTTQVGTGTSFNSGLSGATIGVFDFWVTQTANGCEGASVKVSVTIKPNPVAGFTPDLTFGLFPLTVNFSNTSTGAVNYSWDFGDTHTSTQSNPQNIYTSAGAFTVSLIAVDGTCMDTLTTVIVAEIPSKIEIPNVFTPNNDGINDLFMVKSEGLKALQADIINRWGQLMFTLTAPDQFWDGKLADGAIVSEGTYFCTLRATGFDGKEYVMQAAVTIVK